MTAAATQVLNSIKGAGRPVTHYNVAAVTRLSYNTVKRLTQELRRAGLVQAVTYQSPHQTGERIAFIATVTPTGQSPSPDQGTTT